MYLFEARYHNAIRDKEIIRTIEFDGDNFSTEKECYLYAMAQAYSLKEDGERLWSVDLVSC